MKIQIFFLEFAYGLYLCMLIIRTLCPENLAFNPLKKKKKGSTAIQRYQRVLFFSQEQFFHPSVLFWSTVNRLGSAFLPVMNALANRLLLPEAEFPHRDADFQRGIGVYPGEARCSSDPSAPHAKWHLQTAVGLVDLAHLADLLHHYTSKKPGTNSIQRFHLCNKALSVQFFLWKNRVSYQVTPKIFTSVNSLFQ